mmetsp:Transcript_36706/g.80211  ORF Transcript_36706/g.80211 Transcript_36706/m.80211 type:complete len:208 (+) Transcript_36706:752-1375(+)
MMRPSCGTRIVITSRLPGQFSDEILHFGVVNQPIAIPVHVVECQAQLPLGNMAQIHPGQRQKLVHREELRGLRANSALFIWVRRASRNSAAAGAAGLWSPGLASSIGTLRPDLRQVHLGIVPATTLPAILTRGVIATDHTLAPGLVEDPLNVTQHVVVQAEPQRFSRSRPGLERKEKSHAVLCSDHIMREVQLFEGLTIPSPHAQGG